MKPKQFLEKQDDSYIAGNYMPNEVYSLMEDYAKLKMIEENKSNFSNGRTSYGRTCSFGVKATNI